VLSEKDPKFIKDVRSQGRGICPVRGFFKCTVTHVHTFYCKILGTSQ